ncbi:hypothetical protein J4418_02105 [Candidatus Woesearchaeota archaeon]|nr:hypothetical protein [Candidatus Woesearchaeota archaeon]
MFEKLKDFFSKNDNRKLKRIALGVAMALAILKGSTSDVKSSFKGKQGESQEEAIRNEYGKINHELRIDNLPVVLNRAKTKAKAGQSPFEDLRQADKMIYMYLDYLAKNQFPEAGDRSHIIELFRAVQKTEREIEIILLQKN